VVREAIFSILGEQTVGSVVLDLFAGSGALGLEALSRGAQEALLCDRAPFALAALRRNVLRLPLDEQPKVRVLRVAWPGGWGALLPLGPFSLCLLDPPYDKPELAMDFLLQSPRNGLAAPGAAAVWEQAPATLERWNPQDFRPWQLRLTRRWGDRAAAFLDLPASGKK
jgi:16S rRNA (guanine966-N2)-methyltransferase